MEETDKKENIETIVPAYDYVPPELVNLYITNLGGYTPKYIYRIFSDFYSQEDIYDLEDEE
jgi:translation initiation factor eIF-2B subunit beta